MEQNHSGGSSIGRTGICPEGSSNGSKVSESSRRLESSEDRSIESIENVSSITEVELSVWRGDEGSTATLKVKVNLTLSVIFAVKEGCELVLTGLCSKLTRPIDVRILVE